MMGWRAYFYIRGMEGFLKFKESKGIIIEFVDIDLKFSSPNNIPILKGYLVDSHFPVIYSLNPSIIMTYWLSFRLETVTCCLFFFSFIKRVMTLVHTLRMLGMSNEKLELRKFASP